MKGKRVFLYVQHLLGIGHLKRAATLARALAAEGCEVTLASGGFEVPELAIDTVRYVQLPPAGAADPSFKVLLDENGNPVDEDWKRRRCEMLLEAWRIADPHALVIELFPFGRRQMRFELVPLLVAANAAKRRGLIVSSVRDVLGAGQKNPARQDEMLELFERYFDRLLVHGDPALIPFERTFRHAGRIADRLHYTGYIVDRTGSHRSDPELGGGGGKNEVIVSAGGGAVGRRLLEIAIRARPLSVLAERTWRILAGVNVEATDLDALGALAVSSGQGKVVVERSRADFTRLLDNCALSVSQGGYNTIMELLHSCARSVVVPFAGGGETEQTLRARLLAERGLIELIEDSALAPETLAAAVDRAARQPRSAGSGVDLNGAERSAGLLVSWMADIAW